jgi:hypothetical protein
MQVGLTCGQFIQITPFIFNEQNLFIPLSKFFFFHLWIFQEENYQKKI